jgi:hypothetical protein
VSVAASAVLARGGRRLARDGRRLPRGLHPVAWWVWAAGLATAASQTSNPLLLVLIFAVLGVVVTLRRSAAPWARGYRFYLAMALTVIAIRVVFRIVFESGVTPGDVILLRLPRVPTPSWYAGVQIGGPVPLDAVVSAVLDGARLACLLCCIGAANTLANPKRALRVLPGALYELGVAVTVALSVAPQLVESVQRVRRCGRWPSRCCTTRWSGRGGWRRRWTREATAGRARPRRPAAGSRAGCCWPGWPGCAWAPTGCWARAGRAGWPPAGSRPGRRCAWPGWH